MKPGPTKGVPFKWNPDEMFKLCVYAHKHGQSMAEAVALRYGITAHNARSRISRLRQLGYDVPTQVGYPFKGTGQGCGTPAGYQKHLRDHTPTCEACRAHNAARLRAYRATKTTKGTPPAPWEPPAATVRLVCDCGCEYFTVHELTRHTVSTHGRGPHRWERTPR